MFGKIDLLPQGFKSNFGDERGAGGADAEAEVRKLYREVRSKLYREVRMEKGLKRF
jgi:hypothetical protein